MSQQLISRSPDLQQLQNQGYAIEIQSNHLLLNDVPYVTQSREIAYGTLVAELTLAGDVTTTPKTHVVMFAGEMPCDDSGHPLSIIVNGRNAREIAPGLTINYDFSRKPQEGYRDYYDKMTTYVTLITGPAQAIDPSVTAQTYKIIDNTDEESVFHYRETASSRAGIADLTEKLVCGPVAIIGLGGTGGYILDFLAKTPVKEIHLFDGDKFLQHNAFRAPGAPSRETLEKMPTKSAYFHDVYSKMRRKIFSHDRITTSTAHKLEKMEFAFVAVDHGPSRKLVVEKLHEFRVPFIDVGMGVLAKDEAKGTLLGQLRVTEYISDADSEAYSRIPYLDGAENEYSRNIQIAELNALNAALAIIRWKKTMGFYSEIERQNLTHYQIDGNYLINENVS